MDLIAVLVLVYVGGPTSVILILWGAVKMWRKGAGGGLLVAGVALFTLVAYYAFQLSQVNFAV